MTSERALCKRCWTYHPDPETPAGCVTDIRQRLADSFRHAGFAAADRRRYHRTQSDLAIIVRDQAKHIANLEAELLPRLVDHSTQEAML